MLDRVFEKKKLNFWRLSFIFGGLTVLILLILWNSPREPPAKMMSSSMGNTMKNMHLNNITIYDLMGPGGMQSQSKMRMSEMHSHHQGQSSLIYRLNFLTTAVIFLLLPLIIGGAVILAIQWIR